MSKLLPLLTTASQEIVDPYVKSWHVVHSESLLIAMLCSDDSELQKFAVKKTVESLKWQQLQRRLCSCFCSTTVKF